jgi:hypothetical protein
MVVHTDDAELNTLLKDFNDMARMARMQKKAMKMAHGDSPAEVSEENDDKLHGLCQWTTHDDKRYIPAARTAKNLIPGAYEIQHSQTCGIFFQNFQVKTEGLLRFPQTNSDKVVKEIQTFWERDKLFKEYKLTHKRGIILWGPPGSGKSCTIQLIMKDVIGRDGIVIKFGHPALFTEGMRIFRDIEPKTPAVILMEDIDSILEIHNESEVLNILDGVDHIEKIVFLATTNYPERLGARILNRPSRFDKRFKIGHPNAESRTLYFKHIIGTDKRIQELGIDLETWVKDTEGFSIAHLKELFVAVTILGDEYKDAIETLSSMRDLGPMTSEKDDDNKYMGFGLMGAAPPGKYR